MMHAAGIAFAREREVVASRDRQPRRQIAEAELGRDPKAALLQVLRSRPQLQPLASREALQVDDTLDPSELASRLGVVDEEARPGRGQAPRRRRRSRAACGGAGGRRAARRSGARPRRRSRCRPHRRRATRSRSGRTRRSSRPFRRAPRPGRCAPSRGRSCRRSGGGRAPRLAAAPRRLPTRMRRDRSASGRSPSGTASGRRRSGCRRCARARGRPPRSRTPAARRGSEGRRAYRSGGRCPRRPRIAPYITGPAGHGSPSTSSSGSSGSYARKGNSWKVGSTPRSRNAEATASAARAAASEPAGRGPISPPRTSTRFTPRP